MATPERKQKANQGPGSILETPRTQASDISKSTSSKKNQKSPNSMVNDLTAALNNTSISRAPMLSEEEFRKNQELAEAFKNNSKMKFTK